MDRASGTPQWKVFYPDDNAEEVWELPQVLHHIVHHCTSPAPGTDGAAQRGETYRGRTVLASVREDADADADACLASTVGRRRANQGVRLLAARQANCLRAARQAPGGSRPADSSAAKAAEPEHEHELCPEQVTTGSPRVVGASPASRKASCKKAGVEDRLSIRLLKLLPTKQEAAMNKDGKKRRPQRNVSRHVDQCACLAQAINHPRAPTPALPCAVLCCAHVYMPLGGCALVTECIFSQTNGAANDFRR